MLHFLIVRNFSSILPIEKERQKSDLQCDLKSFMFHFLPLLRHDSGKISLNENVIEACDCVWYTFETYLTIYILGYNKFE